MINFQVLQGKATGLSYQTGRFPFTIGRASDDGFRLTDSGVWDRHLKITLTAGGYHYQVPESAFLLVNAERVSSGRLRNGDLLELGGAKLQFWLAAAYQPGLALREALTWFFLLGLVGFQVWILLKWLPLSEVS